MFNNCKLLRIYVRGNTKQLTVAAASRLVLGPTQPSLQRVSESYTGSKGAGAWMWPLTST